MEDPIHRGGALYHAVHADVALDDQLSITLGGKHRVVMQRPELGHILEQVNRIEQRIRYGFRRMAT